MKLKEITSFVFHLELRPYHCTFRDIWQHEFITAKQSLITNIKAFHFYPVLGILYLSKMKLFGCMIFEERNKLFWLDQIFNMTTVLNIKVLHNNVKVFHKTWINFVEKKNQNQNSGKQPSLWNTITAIMLILEQDALQDCNQILRPNDFCWRNRLLQRAIIVPWDLTEGICK